MKPMGRQFYKDKTGGKHFTKIKGKVHSWWTDVCQPSNKRARQDFRKEIESELDINLKDKVGDLNAKK